MRDTVRGFVGIFLAFKYVYIYIYVYECLYVVWSAKSTCPCSLGVYNLWDGGDQKLNTVTQQQG